MYEKDRELRSFRMIHAFYRRKF